MSNITACLRLTKRLLWIFFIALIAFTSCTSSPRFRDSDISRRTSPSKSVSSGTVEVGKVWRGIASFYGTDFHGRKTANGEYYDMYGMTAAHKTLPFGTLLEVKNLSNGHKVRVRVNDRGPFIEGREIDLSYGAANRIGMLNAGVQEVEMRIVGMDK